MTLDIRIIDASVIVKLCVDEVDSAAARRLVATDASPLAAPSHAFAEVAETLTRKVASGQATGLQSIAAVEAMARRIESIPLDSLLRPAMMLSLETGASVYDCLYVAAARARTCRLLTADRRLVARLQGTAYTELLLPLDSAIRPR